MTIAANQPYLFPYLGYFQLIAAVDLFVVCDSMQYERHFWINRNYLLVQSAPHLVSSPVIKGHQKCCIEGRRYVAGFLRGWIDLLNYNYARAPYFKPVMELMRSFCDSEPVSVATFNMESLMRVCAYIGIDTPFVRLSQTGAVYSSDKELRTINIALACGADRLLNLPGGRMLYDPVRFAQRGIDLEFLNLALSPYRQQRVRSFHPGLSIIDVMMNCPPSRIREMIGEATFS